MSPVTRRQALQGAALLSAAGSASATPKASGPTSIKFALMQTPGMPAKQKLGKQMGVDYAIVGVQSELNKVRKEQYVDVLQRIKGEFAANGLTIAGVESHPVAAERIKLGVDGRDEEIENYKWAIDALAKVGIPVLCYNFMAGLGWYRTKVDARGRGGALITEFDDEAARAQGPTQWGEISTDKIWDNLNYFLKQVIPVAEKANVQMALHPDDPPITPLRGIGRILISAKNYRRVLDMVPSKVNGITYCQANFVAMGEDVEALAKEWLRQKKIFFVHFRDIEGTGHKFRESFHDNGQTDMVRMLEIYSRGGFNGPIRPDHAPTMEGDRNDRPGYAYTGKVFAIGYMKGIMEALKLPYA
jgi:mannonate dehydratase